jgi:hypothetical protein
MDVMFGVCVCVCVCVCYGFPFPMSEVGDEEKGTVKYIEMTAMICCITSLLWNLDVGRSGGFGFGSIPLCF